jgi:RNA polymerase sigma-70 factor, ECF subfamily
MELVEAIPSDTRPARAGTAADVERFRGIVDGQYDFIWRSLRRLGVAEEGVDDAAQHVFLVLSNKLGELPEGTERTFLFRTALGVAANARRASRLRGRELADADAVAESPDGAMMQEELAALKQARRVLDDILDGMDAEYRSVFVLAELEGATVPAIAELLEIPTGTAASRLRRAREIFAEAIARFHAKEQFMLAASGGGH